MFAWNKEIEQNLCMEDKTKCDLHKIQKKELILSFNDFLRFLYVMNL